MKFDYSKLKNPVTFYEMKSTSENGMPSKPKPVEFYQCWAHIETVTLRDYQTAISNNTQHHIKIFIRDYEGITNKMQVKYNNNFHNIISVMPSYGNSNFTVVVAEAVGV